MQIDARLYNRYFLAGGNEKRRYPDIGEISLMPAIPASVPGHRSGFLHGSQISEGFLRNVAEKNWSMFRLLSDDEFSDGLHALQQDRGRSFDSSVAGRPCLVGNLAPPW